MARVKTASALRVIQVGLVGSFGARRELGPNLARIGGEATFQRQNVSLMRTRADGLKRRPATARCACPDEGRTGDDTYKEADIVKDFGVRGLVEAKGPRQGI